MTREYVWCGYISRTFSYLLYTIAKENVNWSAIATIVDEGSRSRKGDSRHYHQQPNNNEKTIHSFSSFILWAPPLLLSLHQIHPDQFLPQHELLYGSSFRPEYNFLLISRYNSPWTNSIRSLRDVEDGIKRGSIRYEKKYCHAQIHMAATHRTVRLNPK